MCSDIEPGLQIGRELISAGEQWSSVQVGLLGCQVERKGGCAS
jgi:hypothetical protein